MNKQSLHFEQRPIPGGSIWAASYCVDPIVTAFTDTSGAGTLEPVTTGRGPLKRVKLPDGEAIVRPCRRGGFVRHFLHDAYLLRNRPLHEFRVHVAAYELGVPVPEPLGVMYKRSGLLVRGAIATRYYALAPLAEYVQHDPGKAGAALERAGKLVAQMHDLGLYHPDLNAGNIIVDDENQMLVDLDKASIHSSLSEGRKRSNLLRLQRSFRKLALGDEAFCTLCRGYGERDRPAWLAELQTKHLDSSL